MENLHVKAQWGGFPDDWLPALDVGCSDTAEKLHAAWGCLHHNPLQAALLAEELWPKVHKLNGLAPWLLFVIIITARIHTLSRYDSFDPLLQFFETNRHQFTASPAVSLEVDACFFGGLVFRHPNHPQIRYWANVCLQVFEQKGGMSVRLRAASYLLIYRIWSGDLLGAEVLRQRMVVLRKNSENIRLRLLCHSTSAMCLRLFVDYSACLEEIEKGLALAAKSQIYEWNSHFYMQAAYLALSRENLEEAGGWLKKMETASMPECYLDRSGYHYAMAWWHMLREEKAFAYTHAKEAVRVVKLSGAIFPQAAVHVAMAQVYMDQQHPMLAFKELGHMRRIGRSLPQQSALPFIRGLIHAHVCFRMNMQERGLRALRKAFAIGSEQRYVNFPWWRSHHMAELCARALAADIEPEYTRWVIRQRRLTPPESMPMCDKWYWPLRIELLSGGRMLLDGEEIVFGGKLSQFMLMLACLGGRDTWVSRVKLTDLLWPDSEGDKAQRSLDTAIHRLRRQLHSEAMLQTRTGFVRLNPGLVQVDWDLFRRQLEETKDPQQLIILLLKGLELLSQLPWELADLLNAGYIKRRISQRIFMLVSTDLHAHPSVVDWLEEALERLPDNERLWRLLIKVHVEQGYPSAAVKAWKRYQLKGRDLGFEPSAATKELIKPWVS